MTATRECEHGLPPGCPPHRPRVASRAPSVARRALHAAVIVTLAVLDLAVLILIAARVVWPAVRALIGGGW